MTAGLAVGTGSTGVVVATWVLALELHAGLGLGAIVVASTLGTAASARESVALVELRTGAVGPVVACATVGALAAS